MSQPKKAPSNVATIIFMVVLCCSCALILSLLAGALKERQEDAQALDRAKQMLMSAKIFHPDGYFLIGDGKGEYQPAKHAGGGRLVAATAEDIASADDIFTIYQTRIQAFLVDAKGDRTTFSEAGINQQDYLKDFRKTGYDLQALKLIYEIRPNPGTGDQEKADGYIFHVTGFGLWDAIYGYLAVGPDAGEVIGISWYEHKETPGLGANISEASWQSLFPGKQIFEESAEGSTDYARAPLGIRVVRGLVSDVYPSGPKSKTSVDGMAGATLTGNGVTKAYKDTLENYRPFLLRLREANPKQSPTGSE